MLTLRRPPQPMLADLASGLSSLEPGESAPGRSASVEETIGWGIKRFDRARLALRRLEQFRVDGTFIAPATYAADGTRLLVVGRRVGMWTIGPVEITSYSEEETRVVCELRTLEGHPLVGTERFELQRLPNGIVRLGIHATSRPAVWWAWLGYPVIRWAQRSFRLAAIDRIRLVTGRSTAEGG